MVDIDQYSEERDDVSLVTIILFKSFSEQLASLDVR
jgi:hypothetical protein